MAKMVEKIKSLFGTKKVSPEKEEVKKDVFNEDLKNGNYAKVREHLTENKKLSSWQEEELADRDDDYDDDDDDDDDDVVDDVDDYDDELDEYYKSWNDYIDVQLDIQERKKQLLARKGELKGQTLGGDSAQATPKNRGKGADLPEGVTPSKKMRKEGR